MTGQPDTYPATESDATAHNVARHMARVANWRFRKVIEHVGKPDGLYHANISAMCAQFGIAHLLREIADRGHGDLADDLARDLHSFWDGDGTMGELLWEWVEKYGLDPEGDDAVPLEVPELEPATT